MLVAGAETVGVDDDELDAAEVRLARLPPSAAA